MGVISYSDVYNLMEEIIINTNFPKIGILTYVHKNDHNLACDRYFFLKPSPFCSTHAELSIHTKNSIFMKNPKWSLFLQQVTYYFNYNYFIHVVQKISLPVCMAVDINTTVTHDLPEPLLYSRYLATHYGCSVVTLCNTLLNV